MCFKPGVFTLAILAAAAVPAHAAVRFGVRAGGHPQGHPGIDFYAQAGAAVFASASVRVDSISDEPSEPPLQQKNIRLEHGVGQTYYIGAFWRTDVSVSDDVRKGQRLEE